MNYDRIRTTVDVDRMQQSRALFIGGAYGLAQDLVRCGLGALAYVDFDRIDPTNPARQDLHSADIGQYKAHALARSVRQINADVEVETLTQDFCAIADDELDELVRDCDVIIAATDFFPAQARANLVAVRNGKPAVWIGMYREGRAGEIVYWSADRSLTPACYRCVCSSRYTAFAAHAQGAPNTTQIPSSGGTVLDLHLLDAIAGQVAVGLLTRGADNRMGRLIEQLGNRNLLQVKIDPMYRMGEKDIFARRLGNDPANFSFCTIALPMLPETGCPDCGGMGSADFVRNAA
jgi:hypothetical protein